MVRCIQIINNSKRKIKDKSGLGEKLSRFNPPPIHNYVTTVRTHIYYEFLNKGSANSYVHRHTKA